jgi:hypothetical protein
MPKHDFLSNVMLIVFDLLLDTLKFVRVSLRPRWALAAENLFLRKQLALYLKRKVKSRRAEAAQVDSGVAFRIVCVAGSSDRR